MSGNNADILERLFALVEARQGADPAHSYTAKLLTGGAPAITAKITEESGETVVAALQEGPAAVTRESADLLYHLCVLWVQQGIRPRDVGAELARREGTSGIDEKAARGERKPGKE